MAGKAQRLEAGTPTTVAGHRQQQMPMTRHYDIDRSGCNFEAVNNCMISTLHRPARHGKRNPARSHTAWYGDGVNVTDAVEEMVAVATSQFNIDYNLSLRQDTC